LRAGIVRRGIGDRYRTSYRSRVDVLAKRTRFLVAPIITATRAARGVHDVDIASLATTPRRLCVMLHYALGFERNLVEFSVGLSYFVRLLPPADWKTFRERFRRIARRAFRRVRQRATRLVTRALGRAGFLDDVRRPP